MDSNTDDEDQFLMEEENNEVEVESVTNNINDRKKQLIKEMLQSETLDEVDHILQSWSLRSTQCAVPIKKDHLYFKCADCSTQPSHCICEDCFLSADHTDHSFLYFNKLTVSKQSNVFLVIDS